MSRLFLYVKLMKNTISVSFHWFDKEAERDFLLPQYETEQSAGMDVRINITEDTVLAPGERILFPTGFGLAIPPGYEMQIRPRSGLAVKHGITVINSPGTIDSDYRGEVRIGLVNLGDKAYTFSRGDRVAQMILAPVVQAQFVVCDSLETTARGAGGFGHTGVK